MNFDEILLHLGDFGRYQRRIYVMACLFYFPAAWVTLMQVFATGYSDHWCQVPWWNNTICEDHGYSARFCDGDLKKIINIPLVDPANGTEGHEWEFQKCSRYNISSVDWFSLSEVYVNDSHGPSQPNYRNQSYDTIRCDAGWEYDRSQYTATLVQELDLVCGADSYIQYAQACYYAGYFVGSVVFGVISDTFGRKPALFLATVLRLLSGFVIAFVPSFWAFAALRFFQGVANIGSVILAFIIATEFVGMSKRNISGLLINVASAIGYMIYAGFAYALRSWRDLQLTATSIMCVLPFTFIFLPESVRWQMGTGQVDKAKKIIYKAAKVNKVSVPEDILSDNNLVQAKHEEAETNRKPNITDLFRNPNIFKRTLVLVCPWIACAIVYHGLNLSTSSLGINVYVSFFVGAAVEIPAYLSAIFTIEWFGRKKILASSLLTAGGACLTTIFIPLGGLKAAVAMVGKFGVTTAFGVLYLFTVELYPTQIRSVGMGFCSMTCRLANILAPLVLLSDKIWKPFPLVIFGTMTSMAGLLVLLLPETKGRTLPETIEDGENFGRLHRKKQKNDSDREFPSISAPKFSGEAKV